MTLSQDTKQIIASELLDELHGKYDGARRNVLAPVCPFCGHDGYKYAVYVGEDTSNKRFGMSNCYICNRRFGSLESTLKALNREDLIPKETTELGDLLTDISDMLDDSIDDSLIEIDMPRGYKRCFRNAYLKSRGWIADDYEYFKVGTNRNFNPEYADYIILEVVDGGRTVGFVARSILSKEYIESHNNRSAFKIRRYKNSNERTGNGFAKLLYNYDAIIPMETHSVIICEGPFDVVALNRKLELYDNHTIVPVATFGKKISLEQMYKLQKKGVEQVVIGFDNDAKDTTSEIAITLENNFDVLIADIPDGVGKDWDEMDLEDIYDVFKDHLKSVREFNLA